MRKKGEDTIKKILSSIGIIGTVWIFIFAFQVSVTHEILSFYFIFLAVILGIIMESRRLGVLWTEIFWIIVSVSCGSTALSLFPLMGERDSSLQEALIELWFYFFIFGFIFVLLIFVKRELQKLTEKLILIQSISILYWFSDIGVLNIKKYLMFFFLQNEFLFHLLLGFFFFFLGAVFMSAFTYIKLSKWTNFVLSIWSSIIMLIFSIDYISRVMVLNPTNGFIYFLEFFLMGISLIFTIRNFLICFFLFIPLFKITSKHLESQLKISNAFIILFCVSSIYYLNYQYKILPSYTLIFLVFWSFSYISLTPKTKNSF